MSETETEWIVTAVETSPGHMKICFYEKHEVGKPGMIICKELDLFEMEHLADVAFKCCMFHVKNLSP